MKKRALISVFNKENICEFAKKLDKLGYEIISTGGTSKKLRKAGINVVAVDKVTNFPEMMNGRVKTLHPKIHAGILCDRNNPQHLREIEKQNIDLIDIVVVNLYPFEKTIDNPDSTHKEIIENIDIGGPTLIRAAAKNYNHTTVVTDNQDFEKIIIELESKGKTKLETRKKLAIKAFQHTAHYDSLISNFFNRKKTINQKEKFQLSIHKKSELRYGENPHQSAALFENQTDKFFTKLHGKRLSYNNYLDIEAALLIIKRFQKPTAVIIKHLNPCGIGTDDNLITAYKKAFSTDTMSPFGGIVIVNRNLDLETANEINKIFTEIIIAPEYSEEALKKLKKKKKRRLLKYNPEKLEKELSKTECRSFLNGILAQTRDIMPEQQSEWEIPTKRSPTSDEMQALQFAWKTVTVLKSNAVCFTNKNETLGLGMGQPSRIDSTEIAVKKSEKFKQNLQEAVCASDAFFPFRDSIDSIAKLGVKAVIQPGGSKRDKEVIQACDEHNIAMVFTGKRHFKH